MRISYDAEVDALMSTFVLEGIDPAASVVRETPA